MTTRLPSRDYSWRFEPSAPCGHETGCGCKAGGACCLKCGLPRCVFESGKPGPSDVRLQEIDVRRTEARRLRERLSLDVGEIARHLGVSPRTVERYLGHP